MSQSRRITIVIYTIYSGNAADYLVDRCTLQT